MTTRDTGIIFLRAIFLLVAIINLGMCLAVLSALSEFHDDRVYIERLHVADQ